MGSLYDTFAYSGGFVALNVISTIFVVFNLLPLQMMVGKKASKNAVKCFCEGHYAAWGVFLGVHEGDQCDAFTCCFMVPLVLGCWVPMPVFQAWNAMASIYWGLNMLAIVSQLQQNHTTDPNVETGPNMTALLFFLGNSLLLNTIFRIGFIVLPTVPGDGIAFAVMLGIWAFICIIGSAIPTMRAYKYKSNRTFQYMNDVWQAHDNFLKQTPPPAWPKEALHPDGFDPLTMGPVSTLKKLREETSQPLDTPEKIDAHVEAFLDEATLPMKAWVPLLLGWFAILFATPPIIGAILDAV